jgi:hypothetical protein
MDAGGKRWEVSHSPLPERVTSKCEAELLPFIKFFFITAAVIHQQI